jgi:alkylresorcinol/alkylpyrone synthase
MFLTGLQTAVPERRFTQAQCWEALQRADRPELNARVRSILQGILTHDNGIETRTLALESLDESFDLDPDTLHRRFVTHAPRLASEAGRKALAEAGLDARAIDTVVVSTCTGYLCPGLSSYVIESLGLRQDVAALDLVGQGCGAALPNLRTADAYIGARHAEHVLSICVEVCSAAFYLDNDLGVLVSACLFGDGAAAAVLSANPRADMRRVEFAGSGSMVDPSERDALRFEQRGGMLRNILTLPVPKLAARHARRLFDEVSEREAVPRAAVSGWILHGGGRKVIEELQSHLALGDADVSHSRAMLRQYGNLSSPFVLFVLRAALDARAPGGWWWMSSFGAGFSCHGTLLRVA